MARPEARPADSPEGSATPGAHGGREAAGRPPAGPGPGKPGLVDLCLAVVIGLCVLLVHDVPYVLHQSFWVDEAWVADSVRASVRLTPSLSSSTPLGWTYLLRLVPFGGPERLRLVPLAFAGLAAAAGYLFGRELGLGRYSTGILTGAAALLSPALLERNDLKQYTAEAFACLVVWVLVARAENEWRPRRLAAIAATASVGMLFANTVIFVGVAAMASLAIECLIRRQYRRLIDLAAASAGMLVVALVIYATLVRPQVTPRLVAYWDAFYLPTRSLSGATVFVHRALHNLAPYMGFRWLPLDVLGVVAGIAALLWLRRFALAVMFPIILVIVIVASAAREYPFGDLRTSTFWLVLAPVLMAVAVAAAGQLATAIDRRMPALVAVVALVVWVPLTRPYIRVHSIPVEDVHSEVTYLEAHYRPGDVVIVSYGASFGFAYYYPAQPSFPAGGGPNGHVVAYPQLPWMVVLTRRQAVDIGDALATAKAKIAAEPADARGRIWIIRSHQTPVEVQAWNQDLAGDPVTTIAVGPDPILLYRYVPPSTSSGSSAGP
jgi:hypothetical protein